MSEDGSLRPAHRQLQWATPAGLCLIWTSGRGSGQQTSATPLSFSQVGGVA